MDKSSRYATISLNVHLEGWATWYWTTTRRLASEVDSMCWMMLMGHMLGIDGIVYKHSSGIKGLFRPLHALYLFQSLMSESVRQPLHSVRPVRVNGKPSECLEASSASGMPGTFLEDQWQARSPFPSSNRPLYTMRCKLRAQRSQASLRYFRRKPSPIRHCTTPPPRTYLRSKLQAQPGPLGNDHGGVHRYIARITKAPTVVPRSLVPDSAFPLGHRLDALHDGHLD